MKKFTFFTLAVVLFSMWTACSTDTNTKEVVINSAYQKDVEGISEAFLYADTVYLIDDLAVTSGQQLIVPQGKTLNLEKFKTQINIGSGALFIAAGDIAFAEGKVITIAGGGKLIAPDGFIQSEVGTSADGATPDPVDGKVKHVKVSSNTDALKIFDDPIEAGTASDTTVAVYAGKEFTGRALASANDYIIGNEAFNAKTITLDATGKLTVVGDLALNNTSSIAKGNLNVYGVLTQKDSTYALNGSASTITALKADFTDTVEFGGEVNIIGEGKFTGANFRKEAHLGASSRFSGAASFSDKATFSGEANFSSSAIFYENAAFNGDAAFSNNATFAAGKTYSLGSSGKLTLGSPGNGVIISGNSPGTFSIGGTNSLNISANSLTIPANSSLTINAGKLAIAGPNASITIEKGGTLELSSSAGSITVPGYNITTNSNNSIIKADGANITLSASGLTNTAVGTQGILKVESGEVAFELTGNNSTFTLNGTILDLSGQGRIKAGLGSTIVLTGGTANIAASAPAASLVTTAGNFGGIYLSSSVAVLGGNVYTGSAINTPISDAGYIIASGGSGFATAAGTDGVGGGTLGTSSSFETFISATSGGTAFLSWGSISVGDVLGSAKAIVAGSLSDIPAPGTIAVFHSN
ncbi:hypothetical protein AGMMS50212_13390 [Spirochaetia bacterium]|nr:hypothetical protein AGMMS50212_13390 [Spirochaetia bacterium]